MTFEILIPHCGDVMEMIDETEKKTRDTIPRCFMIILESLQYPARKRLVMRGDDNGDESNFNQLLKARSKSYPELKDWLSKKGEVCKS